MRAIRHALVGILLLQTLHSCWGQNEGRKLKSSKSRKGSISKTYENVFGMTKSTSKSSKSRSTKSVGGFLGVGFPISKGKGKGFMPPASPTMPTRAPVARSLPNTPAPQQAQNPSTSTPTIAPVTPTNTNQTFAPTLAPAENQPTATSQQSDGGGQPVAAQPNDVPTTNQQLQQPSSPSYLSAGGSPSTPMFIRTMRLSAFYLLEDDAMPTSQDLVDAGETTMAYLENYMHSKTYYFDMLESSVYESTKDFPIIISWEITFVFTSEPTGVHVNNLATDAFKIPEAGKLVKELIRLPESNPFSRVKYVGLPEDAVAWASAKSETSSSSKKKSPPLIAIIVIISMLALLLGVVLFLRHRRKLNESRGRALLDDSLTERSPQENAELQLKGNLSNPTQSQMTLTWSYASSKPPTEEESLLSPIPSNETEDSNDIFIDEGDHNSSNDVFTDEGDRNSSYTSNEGSSISSISHRSDSTKSSRSTEDIYSKAWTQNLNIDDTSDGTDGVIYFEESSQESASYDRRGLL